jgi:uncharacterized membrane protein YeaQ/YmgE (transglycosylase-associated protein family)
MMNEPLGVMGTPGVGFFMLLIIGALAGWIAEKVTKSDHGIFTNIFVGICGSFVGTKLAEVLDFYPGGFFSRVIVAAIGSVIVLYVWGALMGRRNNQPPLQGGR